MHSNRYIDNLEPNGCSVTFNRKTVDFKLTHDSPLADIIDDLFPILKPIILKEIDIHLADFMCASMMIEPNGFLGHMFGFRRPFFSVPFMQDLEIDFSISDDIVGQTVGPPYFIFDY